MLEAIVFNLDGTLLDTLDDLAAAVNWALQRNGMPPQKPADVRRFLGNGVRRLMECAVPQGASNPHFPQVFDDFKAYYVTHCLDHTRPYPGIGTMLRQLCEDGMRLAIVSNKLQAGCWLEGSSSWPW